MKIVVTGVNGQLGYDVVRELKSRGYNDIIGIDIEDLNITNEMDVIRFFSSNQPDIIIHCAAYTQVDSAEDNQDICLKVNVLGTRYLVEEAKRYNSKFIYISTDYVFDGEKDNPYETNDSPNPKSVYGISKYQGELETKKHYKHFIVRISWVFGKNGANFVKTMIRLGKERDFIKVVNDQLGSPTYTYDLSKLLVDMIKTKKYGVYHATNEGVCTWFELTKEIFRLACIETPVYPIFTSDYPTKAKRPKNSMMSKEKLTNNKFKLLPSWKDAVKRYLKEIEVI